MGGSQTSNSRQHSSKEGVYVTEPTGVAPYEAKFGQDYSSLANLFAQRVGSPMNLERAPIFSGTLDPIIQNQVSKGIQDIKSQQSQGQRGAAAALNTAGSGDNSSLLNVLNRQSQISGAGAMNQLGPMSLDAQRQFDIQRQAMIQARNQETMAARAQSVNELSPGLGLLQALQQMAATARGERKQVSETSDTVGGSRVSKSFF